MSTQTTLRSKLPGIPSVSDVVEIIALLVWMAIYGGGVLLFSYLAYYFFGIPGLAAVTAVSAGALLDAFEGLRTPLGALAALSAAVGPAVVAISVAKVSSTLFTGGIAGGMLGFALFDLLNRRYGITPTDDSADDSTEVTM